MKYTQGQFFHLNESLILTREKRPKFNILTSYFYQAKEKLAEVDGMLDLLMSSLKDLDLAGCINILVVSDHGATPATCSSSFYLETFLSGIEEQPQVYTGAVGRLRTIPGGKSKLMCIVLGIPCFI